MRSPNLRSVLRSLLAAGLLLGACGGDPPASPKKKKPAATAPSLPEPPITARIGVDAGPVVVAPPVESVAPVATAPEVPPALVMPEGYEDKIAFAKRLAAKQRTEEAMTVLEAAIATAGTRAEAHVELARLLLDQKDADAARVHADLAVELSPNSSSAWNTRGRAALMARELADAEDFFAKAADLNETNLYAWNNLGLVRTMRGHHDDAINALEHATSGDAPEPYMWNNLGLAYEKVGRVEEARAAYSQGALAGSPVAGKNLARLEEIRRHAELEGNGYDEIDPDEEIPGEDGVEVE